MLKVVKFGGSSLADASQFKKVAEIIKSDSQRCYVVASAPGKRCSDDIKVTDLLYDCFKASFEKKSVDESFAKVEARYNDIIKELGMDFSLEEEFTKIKLAILHHAGEDYVASRGEYLNAIVLAKYLGFDFIDAESGIFFDNNGRLDAEKTNEKLSEILSAHKYAVIPGFYGCMPNGTIKTFSRGGSDITGSIVARAINADIYENWTDVSGMYMADPRIVDNPKVINTITYRELRELAYMGATVLHEEAVFPVRESGIPINIRNTNIPSDPGTMIVPVVGEDDKPSVITGIAGKKGFSSMFIEKDMMNSEFGFGRRVLEVIEKHGLSFEHLPSGIDTMTVILNTDALNNKREDIKKDIFKSCNPDTFAIEDGISLIAVVGRGMVKTKGTAAKVLSAVSNSNINIRMIDQGSSELNIIIAVDENDYEAALKAIYNAFA